MLTSLLLVAHVIGLALAVGAASVKLMLLFRCRKDRSFLPTYIAVARPVTRLIILGLVLLTLSGVGWLLLGREFTPLLIAKLVLVGVVWVLGPIIDNVAEPKFRQLAPQPGESASTAFLGAEQRYLLLETTATGLFYVIVVMWLLG